MATDRTTDELILRWLVALALLCKPKWSREEMVDRMKEYLPPLRDLDPRVFCDDTKTQIAQAHWDFPAYGQLHTELTAWWKEHKPAPVPRIAGPGGVVLDELGELWVALWKRRVGESDCQGRGQRTRLLHLIRERSDAAFAYLIAADLEAADIAVRQGWRTASADREAQLRAEWGDGAAVARAVRMIEYSADGADRSHATRCLGLLRALVGRWAPLNLTLVPEHVG